MNAHIHDASDPKAQETRLLDALDRAGQPIKGAPQYGEFIRYGRKNACWLIAHRLNSGHITAVYGDWREGSRYEFKSWLDDDGRPINGIDAAAIQRELEQRQRETEAKQARKAGRAARIAAAIIEHAPTVPTEPHPYLERKGITGPGCYFGADERGPYLAVPMIDLLTGEPKSIQRIYHDGSKAFLPGTPMKHNALCCPVGARLEEIDIEAGEVWLVEGYATGGTVHQATNRPVLVAFDSGNLARVAKAATERWPGIKLAVAADNDQWKVGHPVDPAKPHGKKKVNTGVITAHKVAKEHGARVAVPSFANLIDDEACRATGEGPTDFNDLQNLGGIDVVLRQLKPATGKHSSRSTGSTASNDGACDGRPENQAGSTGSTDELDELEKPPVDRPCFATHDDFTGFGKPGLYWHGLKQKGDEIIETNEWIASPIHAEAVTANEREREIGLHLRFRNPFKRWVTWAAPMRLLKGSGEELRGELLDMGVQIDPRNRHLLNQWMITRLSLIKARRLAATRTGWHRDQSVFVMPGGCIGDEADNVVFQSEHADHDEFTQGGTLAGWQSEFAALCVDNPMLQLGVSSALAGPLLARVQRSGIGLHWVGESSLGKSTILRGAASAWGGDGFIRTWRATANGLEGVAAALNDTVLILDEIGEADPREIGAIVYAIGNGMGKSRANRYGAARAVYRWRVVLMSSGERSLEATLAEAGKRIKAGQAVRMLNIPCRRRHGVFDELHGHGDGRAFSDALRAVALSHHGHVGPAFIERLLSDGRNFSDLLNRIIALPEFTDSDPLAGRAATSFAALALAGELGIEYGVLPWPAGSALDAATLAFNIWRDHHGRGQTEVNQILTAVSDFIDQHGDSRFSPKNVESFAGESLNASIRDRAGWWGDTADGRVYYFTSPGLKEATKGFDFGMVLDALDAAGWIVERKPGKRYKNIKPAGKTTLVYAIRPPVEDDA